MELNKGESLRDTTILKLDFEMISDPFFGLLSYGDGNSIFNRDLCELKESLTVNDVSGVVTNCEEVVEQNANSIVELDFEMTQDPFFGLITDADSFNMLEVKYNYLCTLRMHFIIIIIVNLSMCLTVCRRLLVR